MPENYSCGTIWGLINFCLMNKQFYWDVEETLQEGAIFLKLNNGL